MKESAADTAPRFRVQMGDGANPETACPACGQGTPIRPHEIADHEYALPFRACYSECDACGTLHQTPMPALDALARFYPESYHSYTNSGWVTRIRLDVRIRRVETSLQPNDSMLDFGCGNGAFLHRAAEKLPGVRFFGYEISDTPEVITNGAVTIVKGDIQELWDRLPEIRLMTINHAIEHLPAPEQTIRAIFERLTDGGIIEGQTPAADSLERKIFGTRWSGYHAPRHTVIFSRKGLKSFLLRVGFASAEIKPAFNPAGLAVSAGSILHGRNTGHIKRQGIYWLTLLGLGTALAPIDLWSGAPGIVDFRARKH